MAFGGDKRMMDQIFNLKFTAKQLVRTSKKAEQEEKAERNKARTRRCVAAWPPALAAEY